MNRASRLSARAMPCHCAFSRMRRSLPARGLYNRRYGFAIILGLMAFANRARCLPQSAADSRSRKPRWVASWIKGKHIHTLPLTQERTRADVALASARAGQRVALVSSGDIGVYAMA